MLTSRDVAVSATEQSSRYQTISVPVIWSAHLPSAGRNLAWRIQAWMSDASSQGEHVLPLTSVSDGGGGGPLVADHMADFTYRKSGHATSGTPTATSGSGAAAFSGAPTTQTVLTGGGGSTGAPACQLNGSWPERGCTDTHGVHVHLLCITPAYKTKFY